MGASLHTSHTTVDTLRSPSIVNNHRYCPDTARALYIRCNNALICPGRICCHAALLYTSPFFSSPLFSFFFLLLLLTPEPRSLILYRPLCPHHRPSHSSAHRLITTLPAALFFILRKDILKEKAIRRSHPPPVFPPWQATKRNPPPSPSPPPQWSPRTRRRSPAGRTPSTTRGPASCWGARRAAGVRSWDPPGEGRGAARYHRMRRRLCFDWDNDESSLEILCFPKKKS